ncbi:DUF2752 domain-containing protein [uncultured Clostridium sp.]|uniref:DUF2752 domain-containing protein n=1 Tax=uncultured Clostridium sp. TaxID=59620 RepID=UPI00260AC33A|nr:DUF2752 domain-containing protein [uncultured Clostridium sp.]
MNGIKWWYKCKVLILIIGIILLYSISLEYVESRSFCMLNNIFEIKCLGCGFSRAFFNLSRLNVLEAINYNKMIVILGPLFISIYMYELFHAIKSSIEVREKSILEKYILLCLPRKN